MYEVGVVLLLQATLDGLAQNDVVQKPLQIPLQSVLGPVHELLSKPAHHFRLKA